MRIAVDAMGGDNAPRANRCRGNCRCRLLCGPGPGIGWPAEDKIRAVCTMPDNVEIVAASQVIENDDKPLLALRRKRDPSLAVALQMLKDGQADAVVSAGNTGALMAGASLLVGRIPGVTKPALAPILPTQTARRCGGVDIGATMDPPRPENLVSICRHGNLVCADYLWFGPAQVGLLNVGWSRRRATSWPSKLTSFFPNPR